MDTHPSSATTDPVPPAWRWGLAATVPVLAVELLTNLNPSWWHTVADIPLGPLALVAAPVLVAAQLRSRPSVSALALYTCVAGVLLACAQWVGWGRIGALALSAPAEELAYRWALPVVVVAGLRRAGVRPGLCALAAACLAAGVFSVLPGHVAQYSGSTMGPLPWVCMALLWSGMLYRGLPLLATAAHHLMLNSVASATGQGAPAWWWGAALVGPAAVVVAFEVLKDNREAREAAAAAVATLVPAPAQPVTEV